MWSPRDLLGLATGYIASGFDLGPRSSTGFFRRLWLSRSAGERRAKTGTDPGGGTSLGDLRDGRESRVWAGGRTVGQHRLLTKLSEFVFGRTGSPGLTHIETFGPLAASSKAPNLQRVSVVELGGGPQGPANPTKSGCPARWSTTRGSDFADLARDQAALRRNQNWMRTVSSAGRFSSVIVNSGFALSSMR